MNATTSVGLKEFVEIANSRQRLPVSIAVNACAMARFNEMQSANVGYFHWIKKSAVQATAYSAGLIVPIIGAAAGTYQYSNSIVSGLAAQILNYPTIAGSLLFGTTVGWAAGFNPVTFISCAAANALDRFAGKVSEIAAAPFTDQEEAVKETKKTLRKEMLDELTGQYDELADEIRSALKAARQSPLKTRDLKESIGKVKDLLPQIQSHFSRYGIAPVEATYILRDLVEAIGDVEKEPIVLRTNKGSGAYNFELLTQLPPSEVSVIPESVRQDLAVAAANHLGIAHTAQSYVASLCAGLVSSVVFPLLSTVSLYLGQKTLYDQGVSEMNALREEGFSMERLPFAALYTAALATTAVVSGFVAKQVRSNFEEERKACDRTRIKYFEKAMATLEPVYDEIIDEANRSCGNVELLRSRIRAIHREMKRAGIEEPARLITVN